MIEEEEEEEVRGTGVGGGERVKIFHSCLLDLSKLGKKICLDCFRDLCRMHPERVYL